jgi:hypothetical protein
MSDKKIEAAKRQYVHNRNWRRARDRALVKLARIHRDEYRELLKRERAYDEAEGRKWIDIDGTTSNSISSVSTGEVPADHSPDNNRTHKSNYGGEA